MAITIHVKLHRAPEMCEKCCSKIAHDYCGSAEATWKRKPDVKNVRQFLESLLRSVYPKMDGDKLSFAPGSTHPIAQAKSRK